MREFGCQVDIFDPWASPEEIKKEYKLDSFNDLSQLSGKKYDAVILAVAHEQFKTMDINSLRKNKSICFDIKSVLPADKVDGRL